jgi:hypothetical protein
MNNRPIKTSITAVLFAVLIIVLIAFVTAACSTPSTENDRILGLPTKVPAIVEEVVEEWSDPKLRPTTVPMDIGLVPMMYYQEAEEILAPYHGMIEGMIFTKAIDLELVDIVDDSANPQRGFQFEALVTVRNNGFATSPQVKLACEIPGTDGLGGWTWVAPLAPGETRDVRTGFTSGSLPVGTYDYTCTIDADNTLIELNKLNNTRTESITTTMTNTDLMIVSVEDISKAAVIGYDHEFKVTVQNVGPERSYKVLMRCSYQKTIAAVEEQIVWVGPMKSAGDAVEIICGFNGVPSGTHMLIVEVDWGNMIDESNETNNNAKLSFKQR